MEAYDDGLGDSLAADIAFVGSDQGDGWGRNLTLGVDTGLTDDYGVRSTWLWTPSDATSVRASVDWTKTKTTVGLSRQAAEGAVSIDGQPPPDDPYDDFSNIRNNEEIEAYGGALKISHCSTLSTWSALPGIATRIPTSTSTRTTRPFRSSTRRSFTRPTSSARSCSCCRTARTDSTGSSVSTTWTSTSTTSWS